MDKKQLRSELKKRLSLLSAEQIDEKSRRICKLVTASNQFSQSAVVMLYLPFQKEVDTGDIVRQAWEDGKVVAGPQVKWEDRQMVPIKVESLDTEGCIDDMGLWNPDEGEIVAIEQIDLVIAPGLGFNARGERLGRGGGFYDRFLSDPALKAPVMGVCFTEQLVDSVPMDELDRCVDFVVTEEKFIECKTAHGGQ